MKRRDGDYLSFVRLEYFQMVGNLCLHLCVKFRVKCVKFEVI